MTLETPTGGRTADPPSGGRLSVLLVDDDPNLLELTRRILEAEYGIHVETAENALDACHVIRSGRVDCVVSDYRMPAVDGLDLLEVLRETDTDVPFVMFTNKGSDRLARRVTDAGARYVHKELGMDQYERLVEAVRGAVRETVAGGGTGKGA